MGKYKEHQSVSKVRDADRVIQAIMDRSCSLFVTMINEAFEEFKDECVDREARIGLRPMLF